MEVSLEGKVALVTGAGPNIGSGIALALSRYGARVACNDLDPDAALRPLRRIERHGGRQSAVGESAPRPTWSGTSPGCSTRGGGSTS